MSNILSNYLEFLIAKLIIFPKQDIIENACSNSEDDCITDKIQLLNFIKTKPLKKKKSLKDEDYIIITDLILDNFKCYNIADYIIPNTNTKEIKCVNNSYRLWNQYKNYKQSKIKLENDDCCSSNQNEKKSDSIKKTVKKTVKKKASEAGSKTKTVTNKQLDNKTREYEDVTKQEIDLNESSGNKTIINFGSGPSKLQNGVLEQIQKDLVNYEDTGCSILEISHRSRQFESLIDNLKNDIKRITNDWENNVDCEILFVQGGGTGQFASIPMNLVTKESQTVDYIITGTWSKKAYDEALKLGLDANIVFSTYSSITKTYNNEIPDICDWKFGKNASYIYYCENETIDGIYFDLHTYLEMKNNNKI